MCHGIRPSDTRPCTPGSTSIITVVPLNVHFGNDAYRDGVDIQGDEFYERLQSGKVFPTTSAPSAGTFIETYQQLAKDHDGIVSLHLSSKVSATYSAALQAAAEVKDESITVETVDTLQASMALGWSVRWRRAIRGVVRARRRRTGVHAATTATVVRLTAATQQ